LHTEVLASVDAEEDPQMKDSIKEEVVDDSLQHTILLEEETRDVITDLHNRAENQVTPVQRAGKIVPTMEFGGHSIYKSTLVSQLNGNVFLSKDRLARIKHSIQFNNHDNCLQSGSSSRSSLLCIGSECGVHFVQRSTTRLLSTVRPATKKKGDV
jgi:hypothetical protein